MNFRVGQKVVCVFAGDAAPHLVGNLPPLQEGATYTIRAIQQCSCGRVVLDVGIFSGGPPLCICGHILRNPEVWWCADSRFAPLLEDEAEQAVKELLANVFNNPITA